MHAKKLLQICKFKSFGDIMPRSKLRIFIEALSMETEVQKNTTTQR